MLDRILSFDLWQTSVTDMVSVIQYSYPDMELAPRCHFRLLSLYVEWMKVGRKHTTIRMKHGAIDYPSGRCLPLVSVERLDIQSGPNVGQLLVGRVLIKPFSMLTDLDAARDGFSSHEELVGALSDIYGLWMPHEPVTIYEAVLCSK